MNPSNDTFVLDANVFISANNTYYAPDLCAEFWKCLASYREKSVFSIDRVHEELARRKDKLSTWSNENKSMFASTRNDPMEEKYADMVEWVRHGQYRVEALEEFSGAADGWLAAYASVTGATLVTHEHPAPGSLNHVKLPDVCEEFGITYVDTFDMLRRLGIRLCPE